MITMDLSSILLVFLLVPLSCITGLSLYYSIRLRHKSSRDKESIYECADCGHVYAFARNRPMDRCPRCGHLNEAVRA
jgi:predicted RNA-binding Zn-ribbon protein involved in translation (DUF1610 family)